MKIKRDLWRKKCMNLVNYELVSYSTNLISFFFGELYPNMKAYHCHRSRIYLTV